MIQEQTKEILGRIDNKVLPKNKQLDGIEHDLKKSVNSNVFDSTEKSSHKKNNSQVEFNLEPVPKEPHAVKFEEKKPPVDLPGAAVIARNIISYDSPKPKKSRTTRRIDSDSETEAGNKNSSAIIKPSQTMAVKNVNQGSVYSNNDSTVVGSQNRKTNVTVNVQGKVPVKEKQKQVDDLMQDLDDEETPPRSYNPPQQPSARVVQVSSKLKEENNFALDDQKGPDFPDKQYGMQDMDMGNYGDLQEESLHDDHYNFGGSNRQNEEVMQFGDNDVLEPEPKREILREEPYQFNLDTSKDSPPKNKNNKNIVKKEADSPKQFNVNELLDDDYNFEQENHQIQSKQFDIKAQKNSHQDDFLDEFEW
uniref:Uncharacterized protein n=1 Tax=Euplotes harpa TaxID=151035 RepID=A0A7S3JAI1_9SPIT|mmetsp:Transcript_25760/g.29663  ORF Transcript_25760/g.29663 Transcript_25760/m.29663 type:complete len:363 (+) Transcript_25760:315-1403(+)